VSQANPYWIGFGDIHGHVANLSRIDGLAQARGVIVTGDLTIRGGVPEAQKVIEAVAAHNPRIYAQIGNMDHPAVQPWLDGRGLGIHLRAVELAPGLGLMGVGWSTPTPFATPSEIPDDQLGRWLDETLARAPAWDQLILAAHNPPQATSTDRTTSGAHVGSQAVRAFIERVQPALCLTGHIHEARSIDHLGATPVINPGDLAGGGYVRLDWDGRTVRASLQTVA
jgi:uncharacterized protein